MGFLDDALKKAEEYASENPDQVNEYGGQGIDQAEGILDNLTGGHFHDQLDEGNKLAKEQLASRYQHENAEAAAQGQTEGEPTAQ